MLSFFVASCDITGGCDNTILSEAKSPDGQLIATVFERDCGATTAANIQVCLRRPSASLDRITPESFLIFEGDTNVTVSWTDHRALTVVLPATMRVFRKSDRQQGVEIRYVEGNSE